MTSDLHGPLSRYAENLHAQIGAEHHVASPLGAWLLLALSATAATDPVRSTAERPTGWRRPSAPT